MFVTLVICTSAAFVGGFIDAIAGGGGLISLPALLLTGVPPHTALSANKFSACLGTCAALGNFAHSGLILWRVALTGIIFSLLGSSVGSMLTLKISNELLGKILVALLPVAMILTLFPIRSKSDAVHAMPKNYSLKLLPLLCLLIGMYDGFFGPGTGSFLILTFHWILNINLLQASATAKVLNFASNLSSTLTFIWNGKMLWSLALPMAVACVIGNLLGSRLAIRTGAGVVRRFLVISLALLMITLIWQYFLAPAYFLP